MRHFPGFLLLVAALACGVARADEASAGSNEVHVQIDWLPLAVGPAINPVGASRRKRGERRGRAERDAQAIVELNQAGILVDLSHRTRESLDDALAVTAEHGIAPVVTHGRLAAIRDEEMGLLDLVRAHAAHILGEGVDPTGAEAATRLAVGWSSGWNGWVSHSAPVCGSGRCRDLAVLSDPAELDTRGLAHPGLLPSHWERLERDGFDLAPMLRAAERFLQLWERAQAAGASESP